MTLDDLTRAFHDLVETKFFGKYPGVVMDVDDPSEIGRLRAKVPEVLGEDIESGWAMPAAPIGGGRNHGFFALPQIGDTVWVEFQAGDISRPIWSGAFWGAPSAGNGQDDLGSASGSEAPEAPDKAAGPGQNVWRTATGHIISMDDDGGVVVLAEAAGAEIRITAQGDITLTASKIKLGDKAGQKLVLGDAFMQLFNAHTHPTGVGPSGPPVQPMTTQHLSRVSKTE
ncbi:hypothetical protein NBRC116594_09350 [Shimia sp. NS0008-38b]|uniref:phage baseplate assembly protein V n=1 Tax=Shimia sp. NS0008-38b TaxID=3127653 RepID=UPI0031023D2B